MIEDLDLLAFGPSDWGERQLARLIDRELAADVSVRTQTVDTGVSRCHVHPEHKGCASMKLGQVLHFVALNRNSFNTLERRSGLGFMKQALTNESARDRYTFAHVAALGCCLNFMTAGVPGALASKAVSQLFPSIAASVDRFLDGKAGSGEDWITILEMAEGGSFFVSGLQTIGTFGDRSIQSIVSVNIATVWAAIASRFSEPVDPENTADFATPKEELAR